MGVERRKLGSSAEMSIESLYLSEKWKKNWKDYLIHKDLHLELKIRDYYLKFLVCRVR